MTVSAAYFNVAIRLRVDLISLEVNIYGAVLIKGITVRMDA